MEDVTTEERALQLELEAQVREGVRNPLRTMAEIIERNEERVQAWLDGEYRRAALRGLTPISEVQERKTRWLWGRRIPLRTTTILAGVGGVGKSQVTCFLAAEATRGRLTGRPENVIVFSAEDDPEAVLKPRLRAAGADLERVLILRVDREFDLAHLDRLETWMEGSGAKLVIFDPLVAYLDRETDSHRVQDVRALLRQLQSIAGARDASFLAIMHFKKGDEREILHLVSGSAGFGDACRSALAVGEDPADESKRLLLNVKNNYAEKQSALRYHLEDVRYTIEGGEDHGEEQETSRVVWDGEADVTERDVFKQRKGPEPEKLEEAAEFLEAYAPAGDRHPVKQVVNDAKQAGITEHTLNRAARKLDLQRHQRRSEDGRIEGWEWEWPSDDYVF